MFFRFSVYKKTSKEIFDEKKNPVSPGFYNHCKYLSGMKVK